MQQFNEAIAANGLDDEVLLCGCFCAGECSNDGVTVLIDDVVHNVTPEGFPAFFAEQALPSPTITPL